MLSAADLAAMRADAEALLPDTCRIVRRTPGAKDAQGRPGPPADTVVATVACRVAPVSPPRDADIAQRMAVAGQYVITVPHGADVQPRDAITIGGRTFEIAGKPGQGSWPTTTRVYATEVT